MNEGRGASIRANMKTMNVQQIKCRPIGKNVKKYVLLGQRLLWPNSHVLVKGMVLVVKRVLVGKNVVVRRLA